MVSFSYFNSPMLQIVAIRFNLLQATADPATHAVAIGFKLLQSVTDPNSGGVSPLLPMRSIVFRCGFR
jgi:hypothetical protein